MLTLYVPFVHYAGKSLSEQSALARTELLSKSYRDYELAIRQQLRLLFGDQGLDIRQDIAGIVLNRWGHAYFAPQPGFYFGRQGRAAPREVVRQGYGRIAFGHSELIGFQAWSNVYMEGRRAALKALSLLSA